jgi:hypothetical protein
MILHFKALLYKRKIWGKSWVKSGIVFLFSTGGRFFIGVGILSGENMILKRIFVALKMKYKRETKYDITICDDI